MYLTVLTEPSQPILTHVSYKCMYVNTPNMLFCEVSAVTQEHGVKNKITEF